MFSVKRFDAAAPAQQAHEGGSSNDDGTSRLAALNERLAKKRKLAPAPASSPATPGSASTSSAPALAPPPPPTAGPSIHPSRLNVAPALRASKARSSASGMAGKAKEKTKAKERYLRRKKDRRKARASAKPKAPGAGKGKKKEKTRTQDGADEGAQEEGEDESEAGSDESDADEDAQMDDAVAEGGELQTPEMQTDEERKIQGDARKKKRKGVETTKEDAKSPPASDSDEDEDDEHGSKPRHRALSSAADEELTTTISAEPLQPDLPETESAAATQEPSEPLQRFPAPREAVASDPALLSALGVPEGLARPTLVDPALTGRIGTQAVEEVEGEEGTRKLRAAGEGLVSDAVRRQLEKLGVTEWFAVQTAVIPILLGQPQSCTLYAPYSPPRDLCVSAPTGSGKTLAYAVPLIEALRRRQLLRLRALVVLPTRDLVAQVRETLEAVSKGSGLRIGAVTGHHSFAHEQSQIVSDLKRGAASKGGRSKVDILIATPGRLMDHLGGTPGFTLQHLRYLVIDEADRLLNQSFQEWLPKILDALEPPRAQKEGNVKEDIAVRPIGETEEEDAQMDALAPAWLRAEQAQEGSVTDVDDPVRPSVQKLLFSATLTRDPAKIAALELRNPRYISVQEVRADGRADIRAEDEFTLPASLQEHMLVMSSTSKPLQLLQLLHRSDEPVRQALCFTKSVESASRLVKLVEFFEGAWANSPEGAAENAASDTPHRALVACDYSSDLGHAERTRILNRFRNGEIDLLVCSDLISRGIDMPHVRHVISYDVPVDMRKYVHRVGRTARAGRQGDAWSLVEEQEARYFKKMLSRAGRLDRVRKEKVREKDTAPLMTAYEAALEKLSDHFSRRGA